jgi:hypothetical protein
VAIVIADTDTTLTLAPHRPGARTAWRGDPPHDGTPYHLPEPPPVRPGVTFDAPITCPTLHGNRIWDRQVPPTQTHGLYVTERGRCVDARYRDNWGD